MATRNGPGIPETDNGNGNGAERRRRLAGLPFNRLIPNILTLLALSAGLTAVRLALQERWDFAILAIMAAAILDGLDGRIARILKGATKFGAELDSLADFLSFGVAPALMMYLWAMPETGRFGWALVLVFSICCALRLARFNTLLEDPKQPAWEGNFFKGVPAPMGAGLLLFPMTLWIQFEIDFLREPAVASAFLVGVAALMVSRIPTYSFKKFKVPSRWILPTMLIVGVYAALLLNAPWATISITVLLYAGTIPFSLRAHRRRAALPAGKN